MLRRRGSRGQAARLSAALVVAVLAVSACSSGGDEPPPPTPTASRTLAADVAWLDNACSLATDLSVTLDELGTAVDTVPTSDAAPTVGAPGFAEARSGVQARLGAVGGAAAGLTVVGEPPTGDLTAVSRTYQRQAARVQDSVAELKASAGAVTASTTLASLSIAAREMDGALAGANDDAQQLAAVLRDEARNGSAPVRRALSAAPSCASFRS